MSAETREMPAAVGVFEEALEEWLGSFTMPEDLAAEMVDACAGGAAWAAALAAVAARKAAWSDTEAMAWGLCVGGLAGAVEALQRSLRAEGAPAPGEAAAAGPARPLLAADGLIAAAHETLGSLEPMHARAALACLARAFGDGGPWRAIPAGGPRPAWAALAACALGPAAEADPAGPWESWADAWQARFGGVRPADPDQADADPEAERDLWDHPAADRSTRSLLRAAARRARG